MPLLPYPDRNAPSVEKHLFCFVLDCPALGCAPVHLRGAGVVQECVPRGVGPRRRQAVEVVGGSIDMSKISNWRQMWDQLFHGFHVEYQRILTSLTRAEKKQGRKLLLNNNKAGFR